mmetsp:Transcript_16336/g.15657  ORF Transcript_16336/g.15657 Transcript_16336/m.15657 type:complete len:405 (+) Transcript_16336:152-1366(+)
MRFHWRLALLWFQLNLCNSIQWATNFGSVVGSNIQKDCEYMGKKICCSLIQDPFLVTKNESVHLMRQGYHRCSTERQYISSRYEVKQVEMAYNLSMIGNYDQRRKLLIDFITSQEQVDAAYLWLKRVRTRMKSPTETATEEDYMYLSRFRITKRCHTPKIESSTWYEWIEPITVHARHPFSVSHCGNQDVHDLFLKRNNYRGNSSIMDVDYILTQSAASFYNTTPNSIINNRPKRFLFDAGTSTFQSSLIWFTCAYSQRDMYMDSIYAWEVSLLEPTSFWKEVPPSINYRYHFYNIPMSSNSTNKDSPLQIIKAISTIEDFVAFKLDIDHPLTEIPVALEIASDPKLAKLIDEFYFELHFQCELIKGCWGNVEDFVAGFRMDRYNAMKLFITYRKLGIRSHFWP